jgi:alpha-tubulin suppressor-like RCC1 family protein
MVSGTVATSGQVLSNAVAVAGGLVQAAALRSDGTVVLWGHRTDVPVALTNVVAISTSGSVSLALKTDGTVTAWGDSTGDLTSLPAGLSNVVAVSAGAGHNLAVLRDGAVVGWGNPWRKPGLVRGIPSGLSNVVAVAASPSLWGRDLALRNDGTVVEWGVRGSIQVKESQTITNEDGEVGQLVEVVDLHVIKGLSNVVAVAAGEGFAISGGAWFNLALKSDGTVFGWGYNVTGEATGVSTKDAPYIGSGLVTLNGHVLSNVVAVAGGRCGLALKRDGTVVTWGGGPRNSLSPPAGLSNVVAIAGGESFCLAITTNALVAERFQGSRQVR